MLRIRRILPVCVVVLTVFLPSVYAREDKTSMEKGQVIPVPQVPYSSKSSIFSQRLSIGTIVFEEDFETGGVSWSVQGTYQMGSPSSGPGSGYVSSNCAATNLSGSYPNDANAWLVSSVIDLPPPVHPSSRLLMQFAEWFELESDCDFGRIKISTDEGNTWTELGRRSGGTGWRESTISLTPYAGEAVRIAFQFTSDSSNAYSGWYVDDISIISSDPEPLEVDLVSLNPQNFPFIYMNVAVSAFGQGVSDLTQSNFEVYENGTLQTDYFEVTPPAIGGGSRLTDVIFLMDNSGSMSGEITAVSNNVIDFVDDLTMAGIDYALGLCRFGADERNGSPIIEDGGNLTQDADYFKNSVWARNVIDGGFEPGWDALYESAVGFNFRPGAQKVFILITDETPTDNGNTGVRQQSEAISILQSNSITTFALIELSDSHAISDYGFIAEQTNGQYFDIYTPFDDIFDYISAVVADTYLIRYRSSDPVFNEILRSVEVVVSHQGNQASATGFYIPGSAPQIQRTEYTLGLHNQSWAEGTPFTIEAEISDSHEPYVQSATLYYKNTSESAYHSTGMAKSSGDLWEGLIPGSDVSTPGLDYYIVATDGQTTASAPSVDPSNNPYQLAILPNVAPSITHTPITSARVDDPVPISAEITDNTNQLSLAKLFYRKTGQLLYQEMEMILASGDTYQAEIPAAYVTPDGVDYFIFAQDDLGVGNCSGTQGDPHTITTWSEPRVIRVPGDYPTIQAGIDAAISGDTVTVADQIYTGLGNVNLDFKGKAIIVRSGNGAGNCIIDCQNAENTRGFYFHSGESPDSVVDGFTIRKGNATDEYGAGGGILCIENSAPTIMNSIITGNSARGGGAICCINSSPVIMRNTIIENSADLGGGIICATDSSPTIISNIITRNSANGYDGGGGGIACGDCILTIDNNVITGNSFTGTDGGGGAIISIDSILTIKNNVITGNSADQRDSGGGGILFIDSTSTMINNVISGNSGKLGGGIACGGSSLTMTNNTMTRNLAGVSGGGIVCANSSSLNITNMILWSDIPQEIYFMADGVPSTVSVAYSDVQDGQSGIVTNNNGTVNWGNGNIDDDPLFADAANSDYHLSDNSPCIGAGTMTSDVSDTDIEGNPRPNPSDSSPDIGAYESPKGTVAGMMRVGEFLIYADSFTNLGDSTYRGSGNTKVYSFPQGQAFISLGASGTITFNISTNEISGYTSIDLGLNLGGEYFPIFDVIALSFMAQDGIIDANASLGFGPYGQYINGILEIDMNEGQLRGEVSIVDPMWDGLHEYFQSAPENRLSLMVDFDSVCFGISVDFLRADIVLGQFLRFKSGGSLNLNLCTGVYRIGFAGLGLEVLGTDGALAFNLTSLSPIPIPTGEIEIDTSKKEIRVIEDIVIGLPGSGGSTSTYSYAEVKAEAEGELEVPELDADSSNDGSSVKALPISAGLTIKKGTVLRYGEELFLSGKASIDLSLLYVVHLTVAETSVELDFPNNRFVFSGMIGAKLGSVCTLIEAGGGLELDFRSQVYKGLFRFQIDPLAPLTVCFDAYYEVDLVKGTQTGEFVTDFGLFGLDFLTAGSTFYINDTGLNFESDLDILEIVSVGVQACIGGGLISGSFVSDFDLHYLTIQGLGSAFLINTSEFRAQVHAEFHTGIWDIEFCAELIVEFGWSLPRIVPCEGEFPLGFVSTCPVDLRIEAPDGSIVDKQIKEIPAIYNEWDMDEDGSLDDEVIFLVTSDGEYRVTVIPEPDAAQSDTYTLKAISGGITSVLAEDIQVRDIPPEGYTFTFSLDWISLKAGWNLISLPLQPPNTDPSVVLSSIAGQYNSVWAYDPDTGWSIYAPGALSDLEGIVSGKGYWIKMNEPGNLDIQGTVPQQTAITLRGGFWNLVGYSSLEQRSAKDCMRSVEDDINSVWEYDPDMGWSIYAPGGPSNLQIMKPGYGYWIKADQTCEWDVNSP